MSFLQKLTLILYILKIVFGNKNSIYLNKFNKFNFKNKQQKGDTALLNRSYTYNLQERLFSGYNRWVRPVIIPDTRTNVTLDFTLMQLISMVSSNLF